MTSAWASFEPHRPLDGGDNRYVARTEGATAITREVRSGRQTLLVVGPTGIGKSTELLQAASLLAADHAVVHVPLDRLENVRRLGADQLLYLLAGAVLATMQRGSATAVTALPWAQGAQGACSIIDWAGFLRARALPAAIPLSDASSLLRRIAGREPVLIVDGLEKLPELHGAPTWAALGDVPPDLRIVCSVPWFAAYGPTAAEAVRPGERLVALRPVDVVAHDGEPGRSWMWELLWRRIASPEEQRRAAIVRALGPPGAPPPDPARRTISDRAAVLSGGIPRIFLQLMAEAGMYARDAGVDWPTQGNVDDAAASVTDTFRRTLLPGDQEILLALRAAHLDGREIPLDRKIRLLATGTIIERATPHGVRLEPHPLVLPLLPAAGG